MTVFKVIGRMSVGDNTAIVVDGKGNLFHNGVGILDENGNKVTKAAPIFGTEDTVVACDYVGVESAKKVPDKFSKSGFHAAKSNFVNAPLIDELPMALECKVKSFEDGILVGEIVNVNADESILTDGKIDPKKLKPISYDPVNNTYLAMGDKVGNAFKDGLKLK